MALVEPAQSGTLSAVSNDRSRIHRPLFGFSTAVDLHHCRPFCQMRNSPLSPPSPSTATARVRVRTLSSNSSNGRPALVRTTLLFCESTERRGQNEWDALSVTGCPPWPVKSLTRSREVVEVTPAEYNLLLLFVQNVDRPLTRDAILNAAWGYDCYPSTRTVDAHVCRLRQKFEPNPTTPRHFLTIHRVGYRFLA
jgi:DNA-binding response OmpR family regulator